jgi:hypothetical protein
MGTEVTTGSEVLTSSSVGTEDTFSGSDDTRTYSKTSATLTTACPTSSVENTFEKESRFGGIDFLDPNAELVTFSANVVRVVSNNSETITGDVTQSPDPGDGSLVYTDYLPNLPYGNYGGFGQNACACQQALADDGAEGATSLCTTTISDATVTTVSSHDYSFTETDVQTGRTVTRNKERHSTSTITNVWLNPADAAGLQTVSDETNYTNSAWLETGFNGLGRYYVSTADVKKTCEVKFTACETNQTILPFDQPVDYEVLLHCAKRTFNQLDPDNPILTWEVDNQRKTVSSKGGPETKSFSIEIPTPATDKTVAALAYSTCTVWKKPE